MRKLYDVANIRNKVPDGTRAYPEDTQKASAGITLEFRCVLSVGEFDTTLGAMC